MLLRMLLVGLSAFFCAAQPTVAQEVSGTARGYTIAVHVSSDDAREVSPQETLAIRAFVAQQAERINAEGGIRGRKLELVVLDDHSKAEETVRNVETALSIPNLVGMIGIWNSTRGSKVVERIGRTGIPWISEMSVESLFAAYPNVYTLTHSVLDEQEVFRNFVADKFNRVMFVGDPDDLYTSDYHKHLQDLGGRSKLVGSLWFKGNVDDQPQLVESTIGEIKRAKPDMLFLSIGSKRGSSFLAKLAVAGVEVPVFIGLGSISGVLAEIGAGGYRGPLYEIAEGGIANLNNERLEQLMRRPESPARGRRFKPYSVGYGARYADLVAMMAAAAGRSKARDVASVRRHIAEELIRLGEGQRVFRGAAQDWSFSRERASSERSLVVWRPAGLDSALLAPVQYIRSGDGIVRIPVLYVHLDMTRIYAVNSNDKSFEAEFFFTIRSEQDVNIDAVEFTNAVRGPAGQRLIGAREVHEDKAEPGKKGSSRIYKISGRFAFEPDLAKYPFDQQLLSISFQPATTSAAFLIQPPSEEVRSRPFSIDGWRMLSHYVGTSEQIIHSLRGETNAERVIAYYNFNYTWVMRRQVVDYVLRVIVPLFFIMIVAYLANFIPRTEFEAIIAIQVTALLSAIALYLALNQPSADNATLSDQIFLMAYATISVMIALSIFEVNKTLERWRGFQRFVTVAQIYLVPLAVIGLTGYILASAHAVKSFDEMLIALKLQFGFGA
jgi:ABC-type branched-subunit amino acid transport system substrate-binding protein